MLCKFHLSNIFVSEMPVNATSERIVSGIVVSISLNLCFSEMKFVISFAHGGRILKVCKFVKQNQTWFAPLSTREVDLGPVQTRCRARFSGTAPSLNIVYCGYPNTNLGTVPVHGHYLQG